MSTPYFSVLVAAYNVDKYLDECLTSLIQQTYLDAEFIVVDDASTDNTKQICEGFAQRDVRFKLVRNEKNEGLLAVRKKAVKMARGQFVVFLDGDDCLASTEALSQLVECTKEHQADIYRFTVRSFGEDEKECEAFSRWLNKKGLDRSCSLEILRDCYLSFYRSWTLWASCYRTDVLKRAYSEVVDERYTCNEDGYASFLIAYFANSYKVCDTSPIYAYRVGSGLTSGGVTCEKIIRNLEISKCLEWLRVFLDKEEASVGHFQCLASFQRRVAAIYYGKLLEVPKEIVNNKGASVPFEVDLALNVSKCRYKYIKTKRFLKVAVVCCVVLLLTLGMVLLRVGS